MSTKRRAYLTEMKTQLTLAVPALLAQIAMISMGFVDMALDWPGIAVALTLMDDIAHLKQENRLLRQRLSRFVAHP